VVELLALPHGVEGCITRKESYFHASL
jgi:hypothetical protein